MKAIVVTDQAAGTAGMKLAERPEPPAAIPSRIGLTMTNAVIECILGRSTTKYYDPAATLSDDQIRELVRIGTTAPTSFHLQNWRFIAVRTPEAKARLRPIAWDQPRPPMRPLPSSYAASWPIPA